MRTGTKWRFGVVATVIAAFALFALMSAGIAGADYTQPVKPYTSSSDCEHCHDPSSADAAAPAGNRVDFTVGVLPYLPSNVDTAGVDYDTACKACHLSSYAAGQHPHNAPGMCTGCHPASDGWALALPSAIAWWSESRAGGAAFNSEFSIDTDPAAIHAIHSQVRWPARVSTADSKCASCHAIAACDACHNNGTVGHGTHAAAGAVNEPALVPWTSQMWTRGYPGNTGNPDTSVSVENTPTTGERFCGSVGCHDLQSQISTGTPRFLNNDNNPTLANETLPDGSVYLAHTPVYRNNLGAVYAWTKPGGTAYTRANARLSNKTGYTATFTFTGRRAVLVSDKDPYRGTARVSVNGSFVKNVDLYNDTSVKQADVFDTVTEGVVLGTNGPHTITIEVTNLKNTNARDYYVLIDQINVYSVGLSQIAPKCWDCHRHNEGNTDYLTNYRGSHPTTSGLDISHVASLSVVATWAPTYGATYGCPQCHSMKLAGRDAPAAQLSDHLSTSSTWTLDPASTCGTANGCHSLVTLKDGALDSPRWMGGCSFTSSSTGKRCHVSGGEYAQAAHTQMAAKHATDGTTRWDATDDTAAALCYDCHTGALDYQHRNTTLKCKSCHGVDGNGSAVVPITKSSCLDAGCHQGKTMNNHRPPTANPAAHDAIGISADTVAGYSKLCTACHLINMSTEHTKTVTGSMATNVTCNECHTSTAPVNAKGVIAGTWNDECTACHTVAHNSLATAHDFTGKLGACAQAGCHETGTFNWNTSTRESDIASIHAAATTSTVPARTSCNVCHTDVDNDFIRGTSGTNLFSGATTCDTCHLMSEHPAVVHPDASALSNYADSATVPTGCTNSGSGCHGATLNLMEVHTGAATCSPKQNGAIVQCHDINGPSAGTTEFASVRGARTDGGRTTPNNECFDCHDGGPAGAYRTATPPTPDRIELYQAWKAGTVDNGHYGEVTHTAGSSYATSEVVAASGGTATATCDNCHARGTVDSGARGLRNQHTGLRVTAGNPVDGTLSCLECHNYTAVIGVVTTTFSGACVSCHNVGTLPNFIAHGRTAPTGATYNGPSDMGCGASGPNCHQTYDLHVLHKGDPAMGTSDPTCGGVTGCHDYTKQGALPDNTRKCESAGCHAGYGTTTHYDVTKHTSATQGTQTYVYNGQTNTCAACHKVVGASSMEMTSSHLATYAVLADVGGNPPVGATKFAPVCLDCHNHTGSTNAISNDWPNDRCNDCHGYPGSNIATAHMSVSTSHTAGSTSTNCGATGSGCHNTVDLGAVGADRRANNHSTCLRCHDRTAGSNTWSSSGGVVNLRYNPATKTCGNTGGTCHNVGYSNTANDSVVHNGRVPGVTGNEAANHAATGDAAGTYQGIACSVCHYGISSNLSMEHTRTSSTVAGANGICRNCHNAYPNIVKGTDGAGTGQWPGRTCGNSTNCHAANWHTAYTADHDFSTETNGCAGTSTGCHAATDLPSLHKNTCADCHGTTKFPQGITATVGGCIATGCHVNYTTTHIPATAARATDASHTANVTSMTADPDALYTNAFGAECNDCHSSALGRMGDANSAHVNADTTVQTCRGCHNTTNPNAAYVITTLSWVPKSCDNCHTTNRGTYTTRHNGYTAAGAASEHTATPSGTNRCGNTAGCHGGTGNDLRRLHDGGASSNASNPGCTATGDGGLAVAVGQGCHRLLNTRPTVKSCGTGGTCHTTYIDGNHGVAGAHQLSRYGAVTYAATATVDTTYTASSCIWVCHTNDLDRVHGLEGGVQETGGNSFLTTTGASGTFACTTCHAAPVGSTVRTIADSDTVTVKRTSRCTHCHNGVAASKPHDGNNPANGLRAGARLVLDYGATGTGVDASVSGHIQPAGQPYTLAYTNTYWMNNTQSGTNSTSWFRATPGGTTHTFVFDVEASPMLLANAPTPLENGSTALSTTTRVACADCHGEFIAAGPQGGAQLLVGRFNSGTYTVAWSAATGANWTTSICGRCHTGNGGASALHQQNGAHFLTSTCTQCHIGVPHAWKRPKLLSKSGAGAAGDAGHNALADAAPYLAATGNLVGWNKAQTSAITAWSSAGNCESGGTGGCSGKHDSTVVPGDITP